MRMKRMAGTLAASTLALAGIGIATAPAANATGAVSCSYTGHMAVLSGSGPSQCFASTWNYNWIEVDGWGQLCPKNGGTVEIQFSGNNYVNNYSDRCSPWGNIYQFNVV